MIIDQLPLLGGDPQDDDEFPIERGTTTYKTKLQALAAGIFGKIASSATPLMDGNASPGSGTSAAREDHVHPTDTTRASAAALATYVRPNLLDNWYFVGGGSQLGYGVFPVNQRGQTSYPNSGYFIDRWLHTLLSATIAAQYVTIANTTTSPHAINQPLNSTSAIKGKTVTLSFLTDTAIVSATISLPAATSTDWTDGQIHLYGDTATYFGSIRLSLINGALSVYVIVNANTNVNFLAAKLEIGSTQTLAHQENGAWVLNEIPDYGEQLTACQHYAVLLPGTSVYNGYANSETVVRIAVPCHAQFAGTPSLQYGGTGFSYLRLIGNGVALSPTSATALNAGNEIVLEFTVSGATQNATYALKNDGATILMYV